MRDAQRDRLPLVVGRRVVERPASLKIVISSLVGDQNNAGNVSWSYASSGAGRGIKSPYPLPTGLTEPGSSVIVAEVTYAFTPLVNMTKFFSPGSLTMSQTFYTRPRKSLTVTKTN